MQCKLDIPTPNGGFDMLERIQRRASKLIFEVRDLLNEERLRVLGLITLKERKVRGDMIKVYKLLSGFEKVDYSRFFLFYLRRPVWKY